MTTIAPTVFEQRLARGCVLSGRSHPATGLWSGRISRGEVSRSFTAGSRADLIVEARGFIAEVCAEDATQQAERRAQVAQDRARRASLKKYPEIIRTLPNLGPALSGTVFRKPGGQNLWRVSLRGPAGYGWEPKQTWTDERSATSALRMRARAAVKVMKADLRRTAAHDKAVAKALAMATQHSDLTLAKDLAWDIVTRKAPELGVRIDTRNGNSTGCCDQAPRGARDSSRIVDTGKGMVLVKSVWWTHHSRHSHTKRIRAALAWIGTSGELVIVQAPALSRTVTGAFAAVPPSSAIRRRRLPDEPRHRFGRTRNRRPQPCRSHHPTGFAGTGCRPSPDAHLTVVSGRRPRLCAWLCNFLFTSGCAVT